MAKSPFKSSTLKYEHGKRCGTPKHDNRVSRHYRCPRGELKEIRKDRMGDNVIICNAGAQRIPVSSYHREKPVSCHPQCGGTRKLGRGMTCQNRSRQLSRKQKYGF